MGRRIAIVAAVAVCAAVAVAFAAGRGGSSHPDRVVVSDFFCPRGLEGTSDYFARGLLT